MAAQALFLNGAAGADSALFLRSLLIGFFFGLYYEAFRFLRLALPHGAWAVFAEDLAFFLPVTGVFILFTFTFSDGVPRWFSIAGVWAGFLLYLATLGRLLSFFSRSILRAIRFLLKLLYRLTVKPVVHVLKKVTNFLFTRVENAVIIRQRRKAEAHLQRRKRALIRQARKGFSQTVGSQP